jgi:hypothetical protein
MMGRHETRGTHQADPEALRGLHSVFAPRFMARAAASCAASAEEHLAGAVRLASLGCVNTALPAPIEALFLRHPALYGFSVRGPDELPDHCPRGDHDTDLFVGDIGISPALSREQFDDLFREIVVALAELIAEEPEAGEALRGRTFARVLH